MIFKKDRDDINSQLASRRFASSGMTSIMSTESPDISVEEWQLLAFFEVEPTRADADEAWPYNDFTYVTVVGDMQITFGVAPAYRGFTLTVERCGTKLIELSALSIMDIRYHNEASSEWLEILLSSEQRLDLRLRPAFSLTGLHK